LHAEGWVTDICLSRSEQQQWQHEQQILILAIQSGIRLVLYLHHSSTFAPRLKLSESSVKFQSKHFLFSPQNEIEGKRTEKNTSKKIFQEY